MKEVYDECEKGKAANEVDGIVEVTGGTEAKKRKMDSNEGWVCIDRITVTLHDKDIVVRGKELSDLHINACQAFLKSQFPTILGFCSTLNIVGSSLHHWVPNYMQIIHCRGSDSNNPWML